MWLRVYDVQRQRRIMRSLLVAWVLAVLVGTSWAQPVPQPAPVYQGAPDQSIEEVQSNTEELSKPIPEKETLLVRELDRLDVEIPRATQQLQKANSLKNVQSQYAGISERFASQVRTISQFDCQNNSGRFQQAAFQPYFRALSELNFHLNNSGVRVDTQPLFMFLTPGTDVVAQCNEFKSRIVSTEYAEEQRKVFEAIQKAMSDLGTSQTNLATALTKYQEALKKRRAAVQEKLNTAQPAYQIGSNLWLLLAILAIACVGTILGIKLFEPDLQMEWVASGQVIQFVTVMILLSVILALGLSAKLGENTLGTLLGGIAGYVLAQGVGRSAARDVARAAGGVPGSPAPSPTPPAPVPPTAARPAPTRRRQ
jgi:hypothetical protein